MNVGILGGGQLGCMLTDAALALGLEPRVFAEVSAPAARLFPSRFVAGSVTDHDALRAFFSQVQVVAFENEFLDCDLLERAAHGLPVRFAPGLSVIRELQDKLRQKELLVRLGLPTAEFHAIRPGENVSESVDAAFDALDGQAVVKWSRLGYDGKGVCLPPDSAQGRAQAKAFCEQALSRGIVVYAEKRIEFVRELAIVAARVAPKRLDSGQTPFMAYPLVVSEQERGICKRVQGPAAALGVAAALESEARRAARTLGDAMGLEGAYALELFETRDGRILVNEIAPRVHNSGHYTQDACKVSQFENHWRAILGNEADLALAEPDPAPAFAMLNLLGPEGVSLAFAGEAGDPPFSSPPSPLKLHWYSKSEIRPGRKVGHVNVAARDAASLEACRNELDLFHDDWVRQLKQKTQGSASS